MAVPGAFLTITGNLTADPELRYTPHGAAVASFTIASTPRTFDRNTNEWKDGETLFMRCSVWRAQAENVANTLQKGMRVLATGELKTNNYTTREGEKRSSVELNIESVGPSLQYASADVKRNPPSQGGGGFPQGQQAPAGNQQAPAQQAQQAQQQAPQDPWATGGNTSSFADEPPF